MIDPPTVFSIFHPLGRGVPPPGQRLAGDLETGYPMVCRLYGITVLVFEQWGQTSITHGGIYAFSGLNYDLFLSLKRLKLKSIYII
jgi:hypothetical protein